MSIPPLNQGEKDDTYSTNNARRTKPNQRLSI